MLRLLPEAGGKEQAGGPGPHEAGPGRAEEEQRDQTGRLDVR